MDQHLGWQGSLGGTPVTRYWVSLTTNAAQFRLSFDGGRTSAGWVTTIPAFTLSTRGETYWIQARAADGALSAWAEVRVAPSG